jgi:hypothetical protein
MVGKIILSVRFGVNHKDHCNDDAVKLNNKHAFVMNCVFWNTLHLDSKIYVKFSVSNIRLQYQLFFLTVHHNISVQENQRDTLFIQFIKN